MVDTPLSLPNHLQTPSSQGNSEALKKTINNCTLEALTLMNAIALVKVDCD